MKANVVTKFLRLTAYRSLLTVYPSLLTFSRAQIAAALALLVIVWLIVAYRLLYAA